LSKYVGWGGLSQAFDKDNGSWASEYLELKGLLSEDEYASARASTLNAHFTSPTVIRGIYEAIAKMGFTSGNILEPSMGIGNFFGMLPESMAASRLYGVELDSLTGRIARQLYPQAEITISGFEKTDRRDFFDLAVGNVPFGQYKVSDKAYDKLGFSIHDYFFAKTVDQVRAGGVIAFVTSRYTMDKQSPEVRKYLAQRAEFLGAIRLPNNAFRANAGTDVVSDIIFLQKRDRPVEIDADWILKKDALQFFMPHFLSSSKVGAVTGNPRVRNRTTLLGKIQVGEYSYIIGMIKRTQRIYGKILTVSGAIAAYRKSALLDVGLFDSDTVTEDIDITWKLHKGFWDVRYEPRALCWVLVPETVKGLWGQRVRWAQEIGRASCRERVYVLV
jgi:hypothetical protein